LRWEIHFPVLTNPSIITIPSVLRRDFYLLFPCRRR